MEKTVLVIATLDTKARETVYLVERLAASGCRALVMDVGSHGGGKSDISNETVAEAGGALLAELVKKGPRDRIMTVMGKGAAVLAADLMAAGKIHGALGIGGNQGTSIAAAAMRALPIGFPKLLVSTVASGNIRPYVGASDTAVMFSVADLVGGPNLVSRQVLANAAAAVAGMVNTGGGKAARESGSGRVVGLSALGNTEEAAQRIHRLLSERGYEVITFHASGAGGSAMEELMREGVVDAVVDLTTHELAEEVVGVGAYQPVTPGRLTVAGRLGLPQVVSFGGLEYLCFGGPESIPPSHRRRRTYLHNPLNANVKLSTAEMRKVGEEMAKRLNGARGPVHVLVPTKGWSVYAGQGGPLYDPAGNLALLRALEGGLSSRIKVTRVESTINDEVFSAACVDALETIIGRHSHARS